MSRHSLFAAAGPVRRGLLVLTAGAVLALDTPAFAGYADPPPLPKDAASVETLVSTQLAAAQAKLDEILAVKGPHTVENTLVPYNEMSIALDLAGSVSSLFQNVHPDASIREAAEKGIQEISAFVTKLSLNRDLYEAINAVDVSNADAETKFLVENTLRDFRRAGVDRDDATRQKIEQLQEEITKLDQDFDRNITDDVRKISLDPSALDGLPQDYIDAHKPDESGKVTITTNYPDFFPFMTYSKDGDARKELYIEFQKRGNPANLTTLPQYVEKRYELATTLGYRTYADYVTENKMIETAQNASDFIDKITEAATPRAQREYAELLAEKRKTDEKAAEVADYDKMFLAEKLKSGKYSFDSQSVRPYFDYPVVRDGIMGLTAKLFNVRFEKVTDAEVWSPDVECYQVYEGDKLLGRLYLDMHPREGKYGHAAQFRMRTGVKDIQCPIGVLVCNFPGGADAAPGEGLMEHDDVETFLHEFGHLLHHTFGGHHRWIDQSGVATERDFVEAPSQFLEEWAWDAPTLQTFAKRYDTGEPIPADLVEKMRAARDFGKGLTVRQQMFYAKVSLSMYDRNPAGVDQTALVKDIQNKYGMYHYVDGTTMQTGFGHLGGYSAVYYTYMWSLVIAKDLFSKFDPDNLLDPKMATAYRKAVLDPGGTKKAAQLVHDFLGRDSSFEAYEKWLNSD